MLYGSWALSQKVGPQHPPLPLQCCLVRTNAYWLGKLGPCQPSTSAPDFTGLL